MLQCRVCSFNDILDINLITTVSIHDNYVQSKLTKFICQLFSLYRSNVFKSDGLVYEEYIKCALITNIYISQFRLHSNY